jgi:hypothetical protein
MARIAPAARPAVAARHSFARPAARPSFSRPAARPAIVRRAPAARQGQRFAAPSHRAVTPVSRSARRTGRHQQAAHRRQQILPSKSAATSNRPAISDKAAALQSSQQKRLQQLQSKRRLSRSERREVKRLKRSEKQNAQTINPRQPNTQTAQQQRLQQLQSKGRLSRAERREMRGLQREDRRNARQQQNQPALNAAQAQRRQNRHTQVTAQQVARGRFASNLRANGNNRNGRLAARRAARLASRTAWQLGLLAPYVPWLGPVYYPYAYNDVFYYTFWPDAYDPGYWAYAYDDFFDGVFFPDGAPYVDYAAEGPYSGPYGATTTGSATTHSGTPGRITKTTRDFCASQAKGITAWPLNQISEAVQPNEEQKTLLAKLNKASAEAADQLKQACPDAVPMTPPGRLQAMTMRLQATEDAVKTVKPALQAFYDSLSDEQKARFNEIGPKLPGQQTPRHAPDNEAQTAQADCSSDKAGLSSLAANRIEQSVQPTQAQEAGLDRLDSAMQKAVDTLRQACPNTTPLTPVGRLEIMQQRLESMIEAANAVRPALEDFYASLSDEQKAKFNRLGRDTAHSGD